MTPCRRLGEAGECERACSLWAEVLSRDCTRRSNSNNNNHHQKTYSSQECSRRWVKTFKKKKKAAFNKNLQASTQQHLKGQQTNKKNEIIKERDRQTVLHFFYKLKTTP
jgi:hypothetical protein